MTRFDPTQLKPADTHPALLGSLLPPSGVTPLNFSPGPTSLAAEVQAGIKALFDAERMCSMYLSHRSPEFLDILASVVQRCRTAMSIPEQYEILFMHGAHSSNPSCSSKASRWIGCVMAWLPSASC